jgi:hypothetical protein
MILSSRKKARRDMKLDKEFRWDDTYEGVSPLDLSPKNYALYRLGSLLYSLMHTVRFDPKEIRYLHRDRAESPNVILFELFHLFQEEMTHGERMTLREQLNALFPQPLKPAEMATDGQDCKFTDVRDCDFEVVDDRLLQDQRET